MGRRRRATPYFHPSSSPARVAAFLLILSRRHTPTNHRQPLSSFSVTTFLRRSSSFRGKRRLFLRSSVVSFFPPPLDARMLDATIHHVHVVAGTPFSFLFRFPPDPLQPRLHESTAVFFPFYRRTDIASSSSTLPPSFVWWHRVALYSRRVHPFIVADTETRAPPPPENFFGSRFLANCRSRLEHHSESQIREILRAITRYESGVC